MKYAGDLASSNDKEGQHLLDFISVRDTLDYLKAMYIRNLDDSSLVFRGEDREEDGTWEELTEQDIARNDRWLELYFSEAHVV